MTVLYCILLLDQILVFSTPTGVCEVVLYVHAWSITYVYLQQQQVYFCSFSAVFLHFTIHLFNIPNALISNERWRECCTPYSNVFGTTCTSTLNTYITCVSHKYVYMFCLYRYKLPKFHGWCRSMYDKGSQSWIKIVYTLKSTNICNIMILHSWVIGKAIHGTMCT